MQRLLRPTLVFMALSMLSAPSLFAAETYFEVKNPNPQTGNEFRVDFFLDTENENVNAIEGKLVFPKELFTLKEIEDGNSIIDFWIERPKVNPNGVLFSGIMPGGYTGKKGLIFSAIFQAIQKGQSLIEIQNLKVLLNNGQGTVANATTSNLSLLISQQASTSQLAIVEEEDATIPEDFKPMVASDPTVFDGKYFLVFATQDKGSGIDRYEVCEANYKECLPAESPYLLRNQRPDRSIIVKAIDKNGNTRIAILPPQKSPQRYNKNFWISGLIVIAGLIIAGVVLRKILWKKSLKTR